VQVGNLMSVVFVCRDTIRICRRPLS